VIVKRVRFQDVRIPRTLHEQATLPLSLDVKQETLGVPVVTYGETEDFPAFYSPSSGFRSPWRVHDPAAAANILFTQWGLGMTHGVLFGVPIPESHAAVGKELQEAVEQAIQESQENGIDKQGKRVTPWLLERVRQLTAGKSLASNIALIENTARKGAQIAVAYSELLKQHEPKHVTTGAVPITLPPSETPAKLVVLLWSTLYLPGNCCSPSGWCWPEYG